MKKHQKLFFLLGVGFSLAILFVSAQFIAAQTWTSPSAPFPGGNTYPPIDTSQNTQTKLGGLIIGTDLNKYSAISFPENRTISSGSNTLILNASGNANLFSPNLFYISTNGLVLPRIDKVDSLSGVAGMVAYDTKENLIKFYNGTGWKDVGTGGTVIVSGGTAVGWSRNNTSGFIYLTTSTDKVGIGTGAESGGV